VGYDEMNEARNIVDDVNSFMAASDHAHVDSATSEPAHPGLRRQLHRLGR
jgi:hypothetical protein